MPIPAPQVIDHTDNIPTDFSALSAFAPLFDRTADDGAASAQIPSVGQWLQPQATPLAPTMDLQQLERFKELMVGEGWPVHVARMLFDRLYAYDRIVLAHTSASYELRGLALDLFRILQARGQRH
jgi:hypothetical protein